MSIDLYLSDFFRFRCNSCEDGALLQIRCRCCYSMGQSSLPLVHSGAIPYAHTEHSTPSARSSENAQPEALEYFPGCGHNGCQSCGEGLQGLPGSRTSTTGRSATLNPQSILVWLEIPPLRRYQEEADKGNFGAPNPARPCSRPAGGSQKRFAVLLVDFF